MIVLKNLAESFITAAITDTATQISIPADHADKFPNLLEGDNFRCALVNPATEAIEFINVTARAGNILTVSRGEEGSAALPFPVDTRIHLRMTARTWEEMSGECWVRPKNAAGEVVLPQFVSETGFTLAGDFTGFFTENRAVKLFPNKSVGFVESATFAGGVTTVKVIEMTVPADLVHVEAGLDPDALAKRTLSNEELLGYMTPVPVLEIEALEVDGGTLVNGTIKHPEAGKSYPDSTEFHFNLPEGVTDFVRTGQTFKMRMPVIAELDSPKTVGPITCRAAQLSLILSDPSNVINMTVRYVGIKAGVTLAYADTSEGWSGGDVTADGAGLPATTTGLNNPSGKAIVSGTPEVEVSGNEIPVRAGSGVGTDVDPIKLSGAVKVGDVLVVMAGGGQNHEATVQSVSGSVDSIPLSNQGTYIHSTQQGGSQGNIFTMSNTNTAASFYSTNPELDTAYFGSSWTTEQTVVGLEFRTYGSYSTTKLAIQSSSNGVFWVDEQVFTGLPITAQVVHLALNSPATAKYFRAICKEELGSNGWVVTYARWLQAGELSAVVSPVLASAPTKVFKKTALQIFLGTGIVDEYISREIALQLASSGSTASALKIVSDASIKDNIFKIGGLRNKIKIGEQHVDVASVSEGIAAGQSVPTDLYGTYFCSAQYSGAGVAPFSAQSTAVESSFFRSASAGTSHFGSQFGVAKSLAGLDIKTYNQFSAFGSANATVQKSDDGTNWTDVHTFSMSQDFTLYSPRWSATAAKYWRIQGAGGTSGWIIPYARWVITGADVVLTTINLNESLAQVPTPDTPVSIPESCTTPSAIDSCVISGNALKFTGTKVPFADPEIKRLAMKVVGDASLRAKSAKIYTEEGA